MMWFVIVIVLHAGEGEIVTIAKEVDSRVGCDVFKEKIRTQFPLKYIGSTCTRYISNDDSSGDIEP